MSHSSESFDLAELQLEQELRQMFEVDSQKDVETYLACVQQLQQQSWKADIQTMYRAIHTIKGGSVTVQADAILQVATVLEDMLSELRYLENIPSLEDGQLRQMLQEGGEIIASVLGNSRYGKETLVVQSKVEHIKDLKQQIQENYLGEWNEITQLQSEFAEQGFDLVVLDLEIAIGRLSQDEKVPPQTIELATQLIEELAEIGRELELASGWMSLLQDAAELIDNPNTNLWKVRWSQLFENLKTCIKQGGNSVAETREQTAKQTATDVVQFAPIEARQDRELALEDRSTEIKIEGFNLEEIENIADEINALEQQSNQQPSIGSLELEQIDNLLEEINGFDTDDLPTENKAIETAIDTFDFDEIVPEQDSKQKVEPKNKITLEQSESNSSPKASSYSRFDTRPTENIQVPIPLVKLDRSAQSIVDTLMIARTMASFYETLHQDLHKLIGIAKDSAQYLAQLREIQNNYTLLNDLDRQIARNTDSPNLERYRQGYVTINRLLENNLRLSEIGTEAEQTARETAEKLQQLNKSITELKDIVEDSRLVPFRNLTFRVRAIVRDLITRYGKSVNLTVSGEQIELDVGTTRRLEPILLHLVRNAYDHGLETPGERASTGKSQQGTIELTLQRFGSTYTLQLQDDGRGIDARAIQAKAAKLNLPLSSTDTPHDLLSVISQPGFSSQTKVSAISGRGVGMDVVMEQISLLNGSLSLETTLGKGTTFKLNFPVPHLLVPCLLVQSGDRTFAIPTEQIVTTSLWSSLNASPVNNFQSSFGWEIQEAGSTTPGLDILGYWYPKFRNRVLNSSAIAVYVQAKPEQSGWWLLADKMLGRLELKIQPFPTPIVPPKGVMGVSLQTDNSLIPVIEISALQEHLATKSSSVVTIEDKANLIEEDNWETQESQTILIVDDAALMRRRIEASLSAYGYTTHTCADGLEAWNWLKINPHPMLMITDIEMPHMDGFTLIDCCRANHLTFPIMVVSSRLAEEWGKEAHRLGATDFLTKGFSTGELIKKVSSLIN